MMSRAALGLLAALLPAAAAAQPNPIDCANATSTVEMNYCAEQEFDKADQALNTAYQRVIAAIAKSESDAPYDPKSWEAALRQSQRAWVAFREAECKGLVPMEWGGGTGTTQAVLICMTRLTKARTEDLKGHLQDR